MTEEDYEFVMKTGGEAFPWDGHGVGGMTLRDYFAAKAMATAYPKLYDMFLDDVFDDWNSEGIPALAEEAYEIADAMLKARKK
mgnify:CR=1 FL=1